MSSSFLKLLPRSAAFALVLLAGAGAVHSQENYFVPQGALGVDYDTNREMNPTTSQGNETYRASAEARIGRVTPRGQTEIHPKLVYQYFEGNTELNKFDEFLDLRSVYRSLRSRFSLSGQYARQDIISAELGSAVFDEFNPSPVPEDSGGVVDVRGTRQTIDVRPGYSIDLGTRSNIDGEFEYHAVKYDAVLADRVGYKSPYFELTYGHQLNELNSISIGPYFSHYTADDDSNKTDTYGAILQLRHQASQVTNYSLALRTEDDRSKDYLPDGTVVASSKVTWGLEAVGVRKFIVGSLRYSVGRFLQPSTLGNRREIDQIQLQYDRPVNARLTFSGAGRYSRENSIADTAGGNDRTRAFVDLSFAWQWTPTIYLNGGYHYAFQHLEAGDSSANNNGISLSIVYRGLQPRTVERLR